MWRVEIGMMHRDEVISRSDLSIWSNFSYFFQAGVHRRVCAVILAVICIAMAAATGPAGAGEVSAEQVVFDKIAAELAGQLHALANLSATSSGAAKVAVAPFKQEKLPLDAAYGREFNDFLVSSLLKASSKRLQIMSRDSLAALISDMINTGRMEATDGDAISALLASAQVDILIVGRIERIGDQLSLSYEAVSSKSATLAQATPRRLPWRSQYERNIDARTLKVAVEDAVRKLAEGAFDLRILRLGGIRFETSGEMTDFSRYLEDDLSVAFKAQYADALSGKMISVRRVKLSRTQLDAMRGVAAPRDNLNDENLGAEAGTYTLTGTYWVQGPIIELRLSLTAPGGGSVGWRGDVYESDLGTVALRPDGNFGVWRRKDGMGPINFKLTTGNGRDPVYRVGEKMNLLIQADRDIWLRCYYLQQDGKVFQIFPNPFQKDAKIAGGQPHRIPGQRFPFDFDILPPAGKELVKCFALGSDVSKQLPPEFTQEEFAPLPDNMKHDLPDLFRDLTDVAMTEQSTVINVVE